MLSSLRRSFGMSPSSSNIQADYVGNSDNSAGVLSPSSKPNTFVPLRRSNSFTNFFSSSRSSSPVKESFEQPNTNAITTPSKASSSTTPAPTDSDAVLAFLVLFDKKGRQRERFPIQSLKTTMGRSTDNDVRLLSQDVSRHHCTIEIEIQPDQDANSTKALLHVLGANGVLLNDTLALPAPKGAGRYQLQTGDRIVLSNRTFMFELAEPAQSASFNAFASPVKGGSQSAAPQTPATSNRRRVRMSLVNAAKINTPARPSNKSASPAKASNGERDERRANGLERFLQSANVSPSKANKSKSRQSLTSSSSVANLFGTPAKSRNGLVEPKTAPPKQVSFSLYSNSFTGRLSPVKQMRMMPPLDTMNEEQDGSFHSENEQQEGEVVEADQQEEDSADSPRDESEEDIVIVEEMEQEPEHVEAVSTPNEPEEAKAVPVETDAEDSENVPPTASSSSSTPNGSPSKSGSPKRAKRRSSFFGRAGPFRGISLGFYAEERTEATEPEQNQASETEETAQSTEEAAENFSDASDAEPTPMEGEELAPEPVATPVTHRVASRSMRLGISKTPSPVKQQHFAGLTPLPRRPRLSLASRRKVSLRTQTLLRSSEAYADRLFLPPPPPTPLSNSPSGLSKSMSMPSNISAMAPVQPPPAFELSSAGDAEESMYADNVQDGQAQAVDFESQLDPALSEEEPEVARWKDSDDDEDEVDQSLSVLSPSPQKAPVYDFSPVKTSALPQFATPQPASKTHSRRISMPPAGASDAKPSIRSALVRLQISGAGERIVHEVARKDQDASAVEVTQVERSSPSKARKVVRVSDVGLPATDLSMGFDVLQDGPAEQESTKIAEALNDLFTAEEEELTDDEEEVEEQEEIVQISSKHQESPVRTSSQTVAPLQVAQTPAALNSVRHLFSAASAAPATPDMRGLGSMLGASPEKTPRYGSLGEKMRANPETAELLSPTRSSPKKKAILGDSPAKGRRGVRRSQAAEVAVAPATPRVVEGRAEVDSVAATPLQQSVAEQPAFEAELHVTVFDSSVMDAENEALAQALSESEQNAAEVEENAAEVEDADAEVGENGAETHEPVTEAEDSIPQVEDNIETVGAAATVEEESLATVDAEEEEFAPVQEVPEITSLTEAAPELETEVVEESAPETVSVPPAAELVAEEQLEEEVASPAKPVAVEPSPSKTRASRRAASASPVKRTARSASPTKRTLRSSPVKRSAATPSAAAAAASDMFAPEPVEDVAEETSAPTEEKEEVQTAAETEATSPTKPTRRTGGRKAKQAATEAISAVLAPTEAAQASPEKPTRRSKAAATKAADEVVPQVEQEEQHAEQAAEEEEPVEEAPKRTTRTRATRSTAAPAKPVRATRTRSAKTAATADPVPSSSAGYGDDEASEDEAPAKTRKRATATRTRTTAARTKSTTRATKAASEPENTDRSASEDDVSEPEQEDEPAAAKTRARAATTRSTRGKAATTATASKAKSKKAAAAEKEEVSSSATTGTTTRSGRTTRRTAAAK